jgi:hypothetical protein
LCSGNSTRGYETLPVTAQWDDEEKSTIHLRFEGRWTWDEFHTTFATYIKWLDESPHKVDFIADMLHSRGLPSGALQQVKRLADMNHPNSDLTVYVGMGGFLQALGQAFIRIYPRSAEKYKFEFASTIEEARAKIARRRAGNK